MSPRHAEQPKSGLREDFHADDRCRRWLPDQCRGRGPRRRAGADAVEFARHQPAHVGRAGARMGQALPCWCATTAAATASRARRRVPIPWSGSAATCWRSLDTLKIKKTNWCGLSMGGMVGQWLGANAPDRVDKLILVQHQFLLRRQGAVGRPHQDRARKRSRAIGRSRTWSDGSPRASAPARRRRSRA